MRARAAGRRRLRRNFRGRNIDGGILDRINRIGEWIKERKNKTDEDWSANDLGGTETADGGGGLGAGP